MVVQKLKELGLLGVGVAALSAEKIGATIDRLVDKGHLTVQEGKNLTEKLIRDKQRQVSEEDREKLEEALLEMNIAQQKDIDQLEAKMADLERKLEKSVQQ